jgi:K+/H+ antiporter YhaU regulatory subunit KhtT
MAGATKVIPIVETTAEVITNMLKKPIITQVLHDILYEDTSLMIEQIQIHDASCFNGKYPADIAWSRDHGVLVISIIHSDGGSEFIYSSKTKHQLVKDGDIFIVIGYEADIQQFEKLVGKKDEK